MLRSSLGAFLVTFSLLLMVPIRSQGGAAVDGAQAIGFDQPASFRIPKKGASAWFRLKVVAPGYVRLLLDKEPEEVDTSYDLWTLDPFAGRKRLVASRRAGLPARVEPGDVLLRIHDEWDDEFAKRSFGFRVGFRPESDPSEPNDTPKTARSIQVGQSFQLEIAHKGDQDWLAVEVEKPGILLLELSPRGTPEGLDLRYSVNQLDETGKAIERRGIRPCTEGHGYFIGKPGRYLLRVLDEWNDEWSPSKALFRTRLLPQEDANEPNDTPDKARGLGLPFRQELRIYPVGDRDHFALTLPEAGVLELNAMQGEGLKAIDLFIQVLEKNKQGQWEVKGQTRKLPHRFPLGAKTGYVLRITDEWNDEASLAPLTLTGRARTAAGADIRLVAPKSRTAPPVAVPELVGLDKEEAFARLTRAGLVPVLLGSPSTKVEGQLPPAGTLLEPGARVAIHCPRPNGRVRVPNVLGKEVGEATRILQAAGLTPKPTGNRGKVIRQVPGPGTWQPKGSPIRIGLLYRPPLPTRPTLTFPVPKLIGRNLSQLPAVVGAGRLRLQRMNRGGGPVTRQEPAAGQRLPRGGVIRIWLAAAPAGPAAVRPQEVTVPDVRTQPVDAARARLSALGLKVVVKAHSTTPVAAASANIPGVPSFELKLQAVLAGNLNRSGGPTRVTVVRTQSVAAGKRLARGGTVQLTTIIVEKAAPKPELKDPPKRVRVPRVLGMWKRPAGDLLRRQGFRVRFTGKPLGKVTSQNPAGDKAVPPGSVVTLKIGR